MPKDKKKYVWLITTPAFDYDDNNYYASESGVEVYKAFTTEKEAKNYLPEFTVRYFLENLYLFEPGMYELEKTERNKLIETLNLSNLPIIVVTDDYNEVSFSLAHAAYKTWKFTPECLKIVNSILEQLRLTDLCTIEKTEMCE